MTVYLARHAIPDWTRKDLPYHLPPGPPLTQQGIAEAKALGDFFYREGVRLIYSSPLERCTQTAHIAAAISRAYLEVSPALTEIQPAEMRTSLMERLWPVFQLAVEQSAAGPVALITHGGPVNFLLAELGVPPEELARCRAIYDHFNPLPTAGAWRAAPRAGGSGWDLELAFIPQLEVNQIP